MSQLPENPEFGINSKIWICRRICQLCEEKDLSLGMLSLLSGLPSEYIEQISTASITPSSEALASIARAFSLPIEELTPPQND